MVDRAKDPERQRLGRLGALTVHARGRTNVGPARAAWTEALASEFGIGPDLDPDERERRLALAMRVRMSRIAAARWAAKKKPTPVGQARRRKAADPRCARCGDVLTGGVPFLDVDGRYQHVDPCESAAERDAQLRAMAELAEDARDDGGDP